MLACRPQALAVKPRATTIAPAPVAQPVPTPAPIHPTKRPASVAPPVVAAGGRVFASSLVRAGDAWALAYYRARNSVDSDLYLVRFDDEARVLSDTYLGPGIPAALAWSGDTLGIAYSDFEGSDYAAYFARADAQGRLIEGSRVRLTNSPCYAPRVVWNDKRQEWGVAWHSSREAQPRVRLTRIAGSGVLLDTHELAAGGTGATAALVSLRGHYHLLLNPSLRWVEYDGAQIVASADLATHAQDPGLVADGEALVASWVEGSKAMVARIEGGQVRSQRTLFDAGAGRHVQGLVVAPYPSDPMVFWGEHTSAVYDTAIFAARVTGTATTSPIPLDPTPEPQGFPFVASTSERLMLVYQLGDYNGAPRLVARKIGPQELLERVVAVPAPARDLCEALNRNQSKLTPEEHMRRYGCPPCPCACNNGQIVCAPCAACEGFGGRTELPDQEVPTPQGRKR